MANEELVKELEMEHKRNLEDIIRHARWEAEMVLKLGRKWFKMRDEWLWRALEADMRLWSDPRVRKALIKALLVKDRLKRSR